MAPTVRQDGTETPQSAAGLHEEERIQAWNELTQCLKAREKLVEQLLTLEEKILETSAVDDALSMNINESSELIATMCDILEADTDSNSDLVLTLLEDISAEELSRDTIMQDKICYATQIFSYNNEHTEVMSQLSQLESEMQILEQFLS